MKSLAQLHKFYIVFIASFFLGQSAKANTQVNLSEALLAHKVSVVFTSKGGHTGNCVAIKLANLTNDEMNIKIDPGDKLMADDTTMQNIFITHSDLIALAPKGTQLKTIYGFCCAVTKHSPAKDIHFTFLKNRNEKEVKLAQFMDSHRSLDESALQHAIWVVCNGEDPAGIYADEQTELQELKKLVAEITGKPIPWYTKKFDRDSTGMLVRRALQLNAVMHFDLLQPSEVVVVIMDAHDNTMKTPLPEKLLERGHYDFEYNWETNMIPPGKYFARIYANGQMIQEKEIDL